MCLARRWRTALRLHKGLRLLLVIAGLTLWNIGSPPRPALACTCAGSPGPNAAAIGSDAVFSGLVLHEERHPGDGRDGWIPVPALVYSILVADVWKGEVPDTVDVITAASGAACGRPLKVGSSYLVFANLAKGTLRTGLCSPTQSLRGESAAFDVLGPPPADPGAAQADPHFVRSILQDSTSPDAERRARSADELAWIYRIPSEVGRERIAERISALISDPEASVRERAIESLRWPVRDGLVPLEVGESALGDSDPEVRIAALKLFMDVGRDTRQQLTLLEKAFGDSVSQVRSTAARLLGQSKHHGSFRTGEARSEAIRLLLRATADLDSNVQVNALRSLRGRAPLPAETPLESLLDLVDAPHPEVRRNAYELVGVLGADSSLVFPLFRKAQQDAELGVQHAAVRGLCSYAKQNGDALPAVLLLLKSFAANLNYRVTVTVVREMADLPASPEVCAAIVDFISDRHHSVKREVVRSLGPDVCEFERVEALLRAVIEKEGGSTIGRVAEATLERHEERRSVE